MRSINQITRFIKDIAEDHPQVNTVVTGEKFEREAHERYPLIHITPGPWALQGNRLVIKYLLICLDLGSEDGVHREENQSDTMLVLTDIITRLNTDGQELATAYLEFEMNGEATKVVDGELDNATGWICEISCMQQYEQNDCEIPIP